MNIQVTTTTGATCTIELVEKTIERNDSGDVNEIKGEGIDQNSGEEIYVNVIKDRNEPRVAADLIEMSSNITSTNIDIAAQINDNMNSQPD